MMWLLLGPLAAAAFVFALVKRVEIPVMEELPEEPPAGETS